MEVDGDDRNLYENAKLNHPRNLLGFQGDSSVLLEVDGDVLNLYENAKFNHSHNLPGFQVDGSVLVEVDDDDRIDTRTRN